MIKENGRKEPKLVGFLEFCQIRWSRESHDILFTFNCFSPTLNLTRLDTWTNICRSYESNDLSELFSSRGLLLIFLFIFLLLSSPFQLETSSKTANR